jgi:hypothetical protein
MAIVVVSAGDVMEVAGEAAALANGIKGRIDEAQRGSAIRHCLLVHQGKEARPAGGGKTGAAPAA